jgi:N-acetylglucosamine-6-phosphate deacetylase
MRPISHRAPAVLEAIVDSPVFCELICDGVHVHPTFVRMLRALAGHDRVVLVTDAVAWAGYPDGEYQSQDRRVEVRDGGVYLHGTSTLAGSTLTMAQAARRYASYTGAGMAEIASVTSTNAARVLGEDHRLGRIRRGHVADLVVLDQQFRCVGVMSDGRWARPVGEQPGTLTFPGGSGTGDISGAVGECQCNGTTGPSVEPEPGTT